MFLKRPDLRWGVEQRLAFIETRLFWEGGFNRGELVAAFDISVPQASKDLALYQQRAPENLRYDSGRKRYVAADRLTPRFTEPDPDAYLSGLPGPTPGSPAIRPLERIFAEHLPIPRRRIDAGVLRLIVAARREGKSVEIHYQSMVAERAGPGWRRISPHAFAHDGTRWHVRGFCHERQGFLDFILSRCLAARDFGPVGKPPAEDGNWNSHFPVVLGPNPALTPGQQRVVADDYGMDGGDVVLQVRLALLPYFHKRLRLDLVDYAADPREAGAVVKNRAAYEDALRKAETRPD